MVNELPPEAQEAITKLHAFEEAAGVLMGRNVSDAAVEELSAAVAELGNAVVELVKAVTGDVRREELSSGKETRQ